MLASSVRFDPATLSSLSLSTRVDYGTTTVLELQTIFPSTISTGRLSELETIPVQYSGFSEPSSIIENDEIQASRARKPNGSFGVDFEAR